MLVFWYRALRIQIGFYNIFRTNRYSYIDVIAVKEVTLLKRFGRCHSVYTIYAGHDKLDQVNFIYLK